MEDVAARRRPPAGRRVAGPQGDGATRGIRSRDAAAARVAVPCLVALALLLLVAALARDAGGASEGTSGVDAPSLDAVAPVLTAVGIVVLGAALLGALLGGALHRDLHWSPVRPLLLALALVLAVWVASALRGPPPSPEAAPPPAEEPAEERPVGGRDWLPSGPLVLVLGSAMAVGGLLVARYLRASGAPDEVDGDDGGAGGEQAGARSRLVLGLDDVIDELRLDPDPRRAVIRAWARLEDLLAEHRLPRRPSEAPTSYVARVLDHLATSAAAVEGLRATFERAMFSRHLIGRADQAAAADALAAVRDDLGARV